jgi:hypothetical protein
LLGRGAGPQAAATTPTSIATPTSTSSPTSTATATAATTAATTLATSSSAAPSAAAAESAVLLLQGDGTVIFVDGVSRGSAPVRVAVEPGTHAVLFRFPATGEARTESVTVRSGEHATLRADFTGVKPTVRVLK